MTATSLGLKHIDDPYLNLTGNYYRYESNLLYKYPVELNIYHVAAFKICEHGRSSDVAMITGDITFRNPYGFLPGELFGYLPFEVRLTAHVVVTIL